MSNIGYTHSAMYEGQISNAFKRFWSAKKQQLGTKNYVNNDYNSARKESKPDWVEVESEDGCNTFFHNVITKEALWERPTNEDVRLLDGTTLKCKNREFKQGFLVSFNDLVGAWLPGSPLKSRPGACQHL